MSDPRLPPQDEELDLGEIEETDGEDADGQEADGDLGEDADGQEADGDEEGQAGDVDPPARGARAPRETIRNLRRRAQEAERAREQDRRDFEARFRALEQRPQPIDPAAQQRAEQERLERLRLMDPVDAAREIARESEERTRQLILGQQMQTQDLLDRQAFEAEARTNPVLSRVATQVEQTLASERAQGRNPPRRVIAAYHLGLQLLERQGKQTPAQRNAAQRRLNAQRTRPVNGAGDAQRPSGRQGGDDIDAVRRRVASIPL